MDDSTQACQHGKFRPRRLPYLPRFAAISSRLTVE
jgi:hypothetical protein